MAGTVLAGQTLTAALLGVPAWTAMTLTGGWGNEGSPYVTAQYRLWELTSEVECIGRINTGTITDATTIATLPYTPASVQDAVVICGGAVSASPEKTPIIEVGTSGTLALYGIPAGTTVLAFHFWYSLDA